MMQKQQHRHHHAAACAGTSHSTDSFNPIIDITDIEFREERCGSSLL